MPDEISRIPNIVILWPLYYNFWKKKTQTSSLLTIQCNHSYLASNQSYSTYHCVHALRFIPVRAFVVLIAVLIRTLGSSIGLGPSKEGDQGPPMAIGSFFPFTPTKKLMRRVGCTKFSWTFSGSCDSEHDLWYNSSRLGQDISITWNI